MYFFSLKKFGGRQDSKWLNMFKLINSYDKWGETIVQWLDMTATAQ